MPAMDAELARRQKLQQLQDGIQKAMLGLTDLKQVLAVCSR